MRGKPQAGRESEETDTSPHPHSQRTALQPLAVGQEIALALISMALTAALTFIVPFRCVNDNQLGLPWLCRTSSHPGTYTDVITLTGLAMVLAVYVAHRRRQRWPAALGVLVGVAFQIGFTAWALRAVT
jgi:hypothetical protein